MGSSPLYLQRLPRRVLHSRGCADPTNPLLFID